MPDFDNDNPMCPKCDGWAGYLGTLGAYAWFRCVQCGWEFPVEVNNQPKFKEE